MPDMQGWSIDHKMNVPVVWDNDITRGQAVKRTTTAAHTADVAGAGDIAVGFAFKSYDISEDGTNGSYMRSRRAVGKVGGTAITLLTVPLKPSTSGTLIPATTNGDWCIAWPEHTAAIGEDIGCSVSPVPFQYVV
jgi:hypothetical protein